MIQLIAEIGGCHDRNMARLGQIVLGAKDAGFHAVKIQVYDSEKLYAPEFKDSISKARENQFPIDWLPWLSNFCKQQSIGLGASVFDVDSIRCVSKLTDFLKLASLEALRFDLLAEIIKTGKDLMISIGAMTPVDLEALIEKIKQLEYVPFYPYSPIVFFECGVNYPASPDQCFIPDNFSRSNYGVRGYSDHSCSEGVIFAAISKGIRVIELHVDLDDLASSEAKNGHCWRLTDAKKLIENVRSYETCLSVKQPYYGLSQWRSDPSDGRRPLKKYRKELL